MDSKEKFIDDRFGPWVRLKNFVNKCGIVLDWRYDPAIVLLGSHGPLERLDQDDLDLITLKEFNDYISNPLRSNQWKFSKSVTLERLYLV